MTSKGTGVFLNSFRMGAGCQKVGTLNPTSYPQGGEMC